MANIKKDEKTGTYYFKISLGIDPVTGKRRQTTRRGFKKKSEAIKVYNELKNQYYDGTLIYNDSTKLKDFFEDYKKWVANDLRDASLNRAIPCLERRLIEPLGNIELSKITPLMVQKWQQTLIDEGYKSTYVNFLRIHLNNMFKKALSLNIVSSNPVERVPSLKEEYKEVDFWTEDELETILNSISKEDKTPQNLLAITLLLFLFYTGLRFGEANALQWSDIDLESGSVSITKDLLYKNKENWSFDQLKNRYSRRTVFLDNECLMALKEWNEAQKSMINEQTFVFSCDGLPIHNMFLSNIIKRHCEKTGVKKIKVHALRHSHASYLIKLNINVLAIAKRLGHKDANEVFKTYGHLYPDFQSNIIDNINNYKKRGQNAVINS